MRPVLGPLARSPNIWYPQDASSIGIAGFCIAIEHRDWYTGDIISGSEGISQTNRAQEKIKAYIKNRLQEYQGITRPLKVQPGKAMRLANLFGHLKGYRPYKL